MLRTLARIVGGLLAAFCGAFTIMALHDLVLGGSPTPPGVLAGLTFFFGTLTALCARVAWRGLPTRRRAAGQGGDLETRILALAARSEGRLTIAEVALGASVSLDVAEDALDALTTRGRAELQVSDRGEPVYVVHGFLSSTEKRSARDPSS